MLKSISTLGALLGLSLVVVLAPPQTRAATITIPVPDFVGQEFLPGHYPAQFDFGVRFQEVVGVSLHVVGVERGGGGLLTFVVTAAQPVAADPFFFFEILPFPDGPFDFVDDSPRFLTEPKNLSFLEEGVGSLLLGFSSPCICLPGQVPPEVAITFSQVDLIVDGVVIPEPSTVVLLGSSLLLLLVGVQVRPKRR